MGGGHQQPVIFLHGMMVAVDVCFCDGMGRNTVETQAPSCFPEGFWWMKQLSSVAAQSKVGFD